MNEEKKRYAHDHQPITKLIDVIQTIRPSFLIGIFIDFSKIVLIDLCISGAAGQGPAFTRDILQLMASINPRPVIFALSNPTSKAECTAREAYEGTNGQCIFASGSPFSPVEFHGKRYVPGQGNNSYIFPGIGLAIVTCFIRHIPDELFYLTAKTLSEQVTDEDLSHGLVYPPIEKIRDVSRQIAVALANYAYEHNLAALYPKPKNLEEYIHSKQYTGEYENVLPPRWEWKI